MFISYSTAGCPILCSFIAKGGVSSEALDHLPSCETPAGELEAIEEEAGAVDVNLVGGKAVDDLMERVLERSAVMRKEDLEAATSVTGDGRFPTRFSLASGVW